MLDDRGGEAVRQLVDALVGDVVFLQPVLEVLAVQVDPVDGIGRVFHALKPVAGDLHEADHAIDVIPHKPVPPRQERRGRRTHVGEDQSGKLFHGVRNEPDVATMTRQLGFAGPVDAFTVGVICPAVIGTANALVGGEGAIELYVAVQATVAGETHATLAVDEQDQVLAE